MYFLYFSFFSDIFIWILPKAHKILNTLLWLLHERRKESNWEIISFQFVIIEQERDRKKGLGGRRRARKKNLLYLCFFVIWRAIKNEKKKSENFQFFYIILGTTLPERHARWPASRRHGGEGDSTHLKRNIRGEGEEKGDNKARTGAGGLAEGGKEADRMMEEGINGEGRGERGLNW